MSSDDDAQPINRPPIPPPGAPPGPPTAPVQVFTPTPLHTDANGFAQQLLGTADAIGKAARQAGIDEERQRIREAAKRHEETAELARDLAQQAFDKGDGRQVITHTQRWLESIGKADALREAIGEKP